MIREQGRQARAELDEYVAGVRDGLGLDRNPLFSGDFRLSRAPRAGETIDEWSRRAWRGEFPSSDPSLNRRRGGAG